MLQGIQDVVDFNKVHDTADNYGLHYLAADAGEWYGSVIFCLIALALLEDGCDIRLVPVFWNFTSL